jgi:hypothetical protein
MLSAFALASPLALAETFTADFSQPDQWDSTTGGGALWNTVSGRVQAAISANGTEIDFGDGSDGAFSDGPAQSGITVAGNTITLNTDVKAVFKFSSFNLSAGKTLKATGSQPLVLRVLGAATVAGTVDLKGSAGIPNTGTSPYPGGTAGAGGSRGGDAGYGVTPGDHNSTSGSPSTGTQVLGGGNGADASAAFGEHGGGGGCNGKGGGGADATASADTGGAAGACGIPATRTSLASAFESALRGGAGGGGGGGYTNAVATAPGGSGGGGGGALHLAALGATSLPGAITAAGGNGGANLFSANAGSDCGGGGGGGAGGSVWIQSATSVVGSAPSILHGNGGTDGGLCAGGYDGGNGSDGILRVDNPAATFAGATTAMAAAVRSGQTYTLVSKPISPAYGYIALAAPTETVDTTSSGCGTNGTLGVTYEGSRDGINFEHPVAKAQIAELDDYSFIRFKVSIATTGSSAPCLTGISIPYGPRELSDLRLKGGLFCGNTRISRGDDGRGAGAGHGGSGARESLGDLFLIALAAGTALFAKPRDRSRLARSQ